MKIKRLNENSDSSFKDEMYNIIKKDLYLTEDSEVDEIFECIARVIDLTADRLEENEPYAINSIKELRHMARELAYPDSLFE